MKAATRILSLLLLIGLLAGCSSGNSTTTDAPSTGGSNAAETTAAETIDMNLRANHKDNLPDDLDFKGESVIIMFRGTDSYLEGNKGGYWIINDVCGSDNIGEPVSDAVWQRNNTVADRLNIGLKWIASNGGSLANDKAVIQQSILSASGDFDGLLATGNTSAGIGLNNYMRNIENAPYIDYSQPWWWEFANEALSMDGKTRQFIVGDMLLTNLAQTGIMYFNKDLYQDFYGDPDEVYKLVLDGVFTFDRLYELSSGAYKDVNGNGTHDEEDTFGIMFSSGMGEDNPHFIHACDLQFYTRDANGKLTIDMSSERCVKAAETLNKLVTKNDGAWRYTGGTAIADCATPFSEGKMLFHMGRMIIATGEKLRSMEMEYGIIPVPKLDEDQERYLSYVHDSGTVLCVPRTTDDKKLEAVGASYEAMCGEAHRTYMDLFLETAMKLKYSRDALSGQCIDLIMAGLTKDTLCEYATYCGSIVSGCFNSAITGDASSFSTNYAAKRESSQAAWDKAIADMTKG